MDLARPFKCRSPSLMVVVAVAAGVLAAVCGCGRSPVNQPNSTADAGLNGGAVPDENGAAFGSQVGVDAGPSETGPGDFADYRPGTNLGPCLDDGGCLADLTSAGNDDIFLAKFDANGNHLWSKRFGARDEDGGRSVSADTSGNIFVTGYFQGTVNFGGSDLTSADNSDIFLAKYDANGNHLWSKRFGSAVFDQGQSVSADASGNVFVTGVFNKTVNFGGSDLTSAGKYDIFLAKYDANGNHLWSKRFGSAGWDEGCSVSADHDGNAFVTGWFEGTVNFGCSDLTSASNHSPDMFLAKFGP